MNKIQSILLGIPFIILGMISGTENFIDGMLFGYGLAWLVNGAVLYIYGENK